MAESARRLDLYDNSSFDRGRPFWFEALWILVSALLVRSWIPGSGFRVAILRMFGARIGEGVVIKPEVNVKFPWRLTIGDHSWIGERVWIDDLAPVTIGSHCVLSQDAYLCTGNHNRAKPEFDLAIAPITVDDGAWIAARTNVAPGVLVGMDSFVGLGCTVTRDVPPGARLSVSRYEVRTTEAPAREPQP